MMGFDLLVFLQGLNPLAWAFIGFLGLLFVYSVFRYAVPLGAMRWEARQARSVVMKGAGPSPAALSLTGRRLGPAWTRFARDWETSAVMIGGVRRGTIHPEDYFGPSSALDGAARGIPIALPGVFAGAGILGTFLGIVMGLDGIQIGNSSALLTGVRGLLEGMSTAFTTSVLGIGFSIVWLVLYRGLLSGVSRDLRRFCETVEERFPSWAALDVIRVTLENQHRQLGTGVAALTLQGEQRQLQEDHKVILQNLGTDLAEMMEVALSSALERALGPAVGRIVGAVEELGGTLRSQQLEGIQEMAGEFRRQLTESVSEDFERLAEGLRQASELQVSSVERLEAFFEELERVSVLQTSLLTVTMQASERFTQSVSGLAEVHRDLQETLPAFAAVGTIVQETIAGLNAQTELLSGANREIRSALAEQLDTVEVQVRTLTGFWDSFSQRLHAFESGLTESIMEFRNVSAERLKEVFTHFDGEMAQIVRHLSGTLAQIREVTEDLPGHVERLRDTVDELRAPAGQMVAALQEGTRTTERYESHLHSVSAAMERAIPLVSALSSLEEQGQEATALLASVEGHLRAMTEARVAPVPSERSNGPGVDGVPHEVMS